MSMFSSLRDGDDSSDSSSADTSDKDKLQYTIEEILDLYESSKKTSPPADLMKYQNVFENEPQKPESMTFTPPKTEINSTIYLNPSGKQSTRRPQMQSQKNSRRWSGESPNNELLPNDSDMSSMTFWNYKDPMDQIVGPYPSSVMREWLNKRYIDSSLLIQKADSNDHNFQPISVVFPDISKAFCEEKTNINNSSNSDTTQQKKQTTLFSFSLSDDTLDLTDITI
ncbi:GYF domain containing protein [Histomonas meleagridis]|uniref:GYF domain containing protein n=1 Tax=Histomonas meleagridis TaxID=135588 RepID=UPI003559DC70|nr:GYF domain containing protein [Histomonas meleagridis]KAH0797605.1 GYF domain containing protein [Histomonas meleagridis]